MSLTTTRFAWVSLAPGSAGKTMAPGSFSREEPSITMPLPYVSCAWAIVPLSPGTTRCRSKPRTSHNQSIAAGASR
jgi:hypothetical protein